jgi:hypothetical protein
MARSRAALLPDLPDGLTLADAARTLTRRVGRAVTVQDVHALVHRRLKLDTGSKPVTFERTVRLEVIDPADIVLLEEALRQETPVAAE